MFDLEVIGKVREVKEGEVAKRAPRIMKRLRDSHHSVAKLISQGVRDIQVSLQTGYSLDRIATLKEDPTFQELISFYRANRDAVAQEVEAQFLGVTKDVMQCIHERVQDEGDEIPLGQLTEIFKVFADRAGYAPITRSINKNLNVNIGERLDAARKRKDEAA